MSARDDVLARIAAAHRAAPPTGPAYADISRDYRTSSDLDAAELTERLIDRLIDYKALVRRCSAADLAATIRAALADREAARLVIPDGLDPSWTEGVEVVTDSVEEPLDVAALDALDGVITRCAVAVAETGSLVIDGSAGMGRRVISLIPDYHLCVVRPEDIVADVPQAVARLEPTRPLTWISGPSATSDIELNRVEGVHGPRTLEVVIVE